MTPRCLSRLGGLASDGRLDCVELGDAFERFCCDGGAGRFVHLVEFAARVSPARRQLDIAASTELLETWIPVDVNDALEPRQVCRRPFGGLTSIIDRQLVAVLFLGFPRFSAVLGGHGKEARHAVWLAAHLLSAFFEILGSRFVVLWVDHLVNLKTGHGSFQNRQLGGRNRPAPGCRYRPLLRAAGPF